jgi:hypothetical protein
MIVILFFLEHQSFIDNDTKGMCCFKLFNGIFAVMTKVQYDNIQIQNPFGSRMLLS